MVFDQGVEILDILCFALFMEHPGLPALEKKMAVNTMLSITPA
jgi:hypothetical protein